MVTTLAPRTFTSLEVCALAQISYRQLDYWTRRGWLSPSLPKLNEWGGGTGYSRCWSEAEAAKATALAGMLRNGLTLAKAAELVTAGKIAHLLVTPLPEVLA